LILTLHKLFIFDFEKQQVVKVLGSISKKQKEHKKKEAREDTAALSVVPRLFDVSPDEKYTVEVGSTGHSPVKDGEAGANENTVMLRDLISNKIVAKFEGHS